MQVKVTKFEEKNVQLVLHYVTVFRNFEMYSIHMKYKNVIFNFY